DVGRAHHGDHHRARRLPPPVPLRLAVGGAAAPDARGGRAVRVAREYHDRTAHSPYSVRASTHSLDWDVKPFPFKVYTDRAPLAHAAADEALARRAATIILTAIYWRNTWKYQARGYRHLFWDSGTLLAHLLAVGGALGLAPRLDTGFVDADVNRALGVDAEREAALELVTLGPQGAPAPPVAALEDLRHPYVPLSSSEVDYPLLREIHRASMLHTPDDVRAWREAGRELGGRPPRPVSPRALVPLPAAREASGRSLGETIQRRGST